MKDVGEEEVVLKDGKPFLKWEQYETTFLKIWKANSEKPYIRWGGMYVELDEEQKKELKKLDKELDAQDKMKTGDKKRELDNHRKNPTLSTATHKRKIIIDKRPATKSTSPVKRVTKKTAKKSTRKSQIQIGMMH